jgi:hypothetical protein
MLTGTLGSVNVTSSLGQVSAATSSVAVLLIGSFSALQTNVGQTSPRGS